MRARLLPVGLGALVLALVVGCGTSAPTTATTVTSSEQEPCVSCHAPEFHAARHHKGEALQACDHCHSQDSWGGAHAPIVSGASKQAEPGPTATATATPTATATATATPTATATATPTARPKPRPKPAPTAVPSQPPPDTITHPSPRHH